MRLSEHPHMRLVTDDDSSSETTLDELDVSMNVTDDEPQQQQQGETSKPRKSRKRRAAAQPVEETPDERPDGAVQAEDSSDAQVDEQAEASESADDDSSSQPQVDLAALEALLFSTHHPLTAGRLAELLDLDATKPVRNAIRSLNEQYESSGRSFRVEQVAGGYQLLTLPQHGELLRKLKQKESDAKLTKAALETLAIIAYKQPILRADVEAIRGVACGETIRSLMEKHLVNIAGRAEIPGRPILYGTTKRFLQLFGLNSLKDLPQSENGLQPPQQSPQQPPPTASQG